MEIMSNKLNAMKKKKMKKRKRSSFVTYTLYIPDSFGARALGLLEDRGLRGSL